jgi:hypothetical protein
MLILSGMGIFLPSILGIAGIDRKLEPEYRP